MIGNQKRLVIVIFNHIGFVKSNPDPGRIDEIEKLDEGVKANINHGVNSLFANVNKSVESQQSVKVPGSTLEFANQNGPISMSNYFSGQYH